MSIPFNSYVKYKKRYCISYLDNDIQVVNFLFFARDLIAKEFKELSLYLLLRDEMLKELKINDLEGIILQSEIPLFQKKISYIREVSSIGDIKDILTEAGIEFLQS